MTQSTSGGFNSSAHESGGFAVGLSAESRGVLGIGANLLYAEHMIAATGNNGSHRANSLDVPVYAKWTLRPAGTSPFLLVGPQVSFSLSCSSACPSNQTPSLQSVIGAGMTFGTERRVSLQLRYESGFSNQDTGFTTNPGGFFEPPTSFKMRSIRLFASIGL
jgi:hypothetical protein